MKNVRIILALVVLSFVIISGLSLKAEAQIIIGGPYCNCSFVSYEGVMRIENDACYCDFIPCHPS